MSNNLCLGSVMVAMYCSKFKNNEMKKPIKYKNKLQIKE